MFLLLTEFPLPLLLPLTVHGTLPHNQRWRESTSTALSGMTSLEDELRRQLGANNALRTSLTAAEAKISDLTGRLKVDEQLSELRQAVKEGITSERVKYVCTRGVVCGCVLVLLPLHSVSSATPSVCVYRGSPFTPIRLRDRRAVRSRR
jgi:hypothetical protein